MADVAASVESFFNGDLRSVAIHAGRIVLILVVAFVLARVVRRAARKLAARLAERQKARRNEGEDSAGLRLLALGEKVAGALPILDKKERSAQRSRTLGTVLGSIGCIAIYTVAIMLCLSELDVNLAPILAGAGIAGIALGFGAQSVVRDFLSGILIIIEDQYGVGDIVDVGEASGVVEEVTLRITRLRGLDGTVWHVPNGEIRRSGNRSQYWARVVLDVPVAYNVDIPTVSALIKQTADDAWHGGEAGDILEEPELWGVEEFGADSIAIRLVVKTLPGSQWTVARRLRAQLKHALDQAGFEIPFPQRTVWLREQPRVDPAPPSSQPEGTAGGLS
jgi:small-conductance mechanosensitive channel